MNMKKIFPKEKTNIATTVNTAVTGNSSSSKNITYEKDSVKSINNFQVKELNKFSLELVYLNLEYLHILGDNMTEFLKYFMNKIIY